MDFFERFFHISVDGGNGFAESVVLLIVCALIIVATLPKVRGYPKWVPERQGGHRYEQGKSHAQT
jgi:hypothetical protein